MAALARVAPELIETGDRRVSAGSAGVVACDGCDARSGLGEVNAARRHSRSTPQVRRRFNDASDGLVDAALRLLEIVRDAIALGERAAEDERRRQGHDCAEACF